MSWGATVPAYPATNTAFWRDTVRRDPPKTNPAKYLAKMAGFEVDP